MKPVLMIHEITEKLFDLNLEDYTLTFDDGLYSQYYHYDKFKSINTDKIFFISSNILCEGIQSTEFPAVDLPVGARPLTEVLANSPADDALAVAEYLLNRKLDPSRYLWTGDEGLGRRFIIPFEHDDRIVGWTARTVDNVKITVFSILAFLCDNLLVFGKISSPFMVADQHVINLVIFNCVR